MDLIASYPIIPGITFLLILGFFAYQIRVILKERQKAKTPKLPNMQSPSKAVQEKKVVIPKIQMPAKQDVAQIKKKYNPIVQFMSVLVLLLVVVSTVGVFYVYKNQSLPFVPRASGPSPTSPLISPINNEPDTSPVEGSQDPTPTTVAGILPTTTPILIATNTTLAPTNPPAAPNTTTPVPPTNPPTATPFPTVTQTPLSSPTPTNKPPEQTPQTPSAIVPTAAPALSASTPTPVLIAKNSLTTTPTALEPTVVSPASADTTITPKPTQTTIPDAGLPLYLGILIVASLIFLTIGFVW